MKIRLMLTGLCAVLALFFLLPARIHAAEAEWVRNSDGKWWLYDEVREEAPEEEAGWCEIEGSYYRYLTGWQQKDGKWYYLDPEEGWLYRNRLLDDGGKRYYVGESGAMRIGWVQYQYRNQDVWSYAGKSGAFLTGWQKISDKWYYFETEEERRYIMKADVFHYEDGKRYSFSKSGAMQTGWIKVEDTFMGEVVSVSWFYAESDGVLVEGWKYIAGKWYYFDLWMYSDTCHEIDGKYYKFDENGAMSDEKTFWYEYGEGKRFYVENRLQASGWKKVSGKWYYFDPRLDNYMATTARAAETRLYDFDADGGYQAVTGNGWHELDGEWFYVEHGKVATGWKRIGSYWYYFQLVQENDVLHTEQVMGSMYRDEARELNGKLYLFGSGGGLANRSGWHKLENPTRWYYTDASGVCTKDWKQIGSSWYYFDYVTGIMNQGGTFWIKGKAYRFDENGAWIP